MKLLLVANNLEGFGGGERWVLETARRLQNIFDISIINPKMKGEKDRIKLDALIERFDLKNVRIVDIDCTGMKSQIGTGKFNLMVPNPKAMYRLGKEIRSCDVVYQMSMNPVLLLHAVVSAKLYKKRFILGLHNPIILKEEDIKNRSSPKFQRVLLKIVPEMHAQTQTQVEMLHQLRYKGKIYYIPHFLYFKPKINRTKTKGKKFNVLFVGRFDVYQKGLDMLVKIIDKTIKLDPSIVFNLVGSGSEEGMTLISNVASRHKKNVKWHMFVSDEELNLQYSKADLFILSSRYETPGLALLEAQSYGIPAIAFDVQGPRDIMQKEVQGERVEPYDVNKFAKLVTDYKKAYEEDPKGYGKRFFAIKKVIDSMYSERKFLQDFKKMVEAGK